MFKLTLVDFSASEHYGRDVFSHKQKLDWI